MSNVTSGRNSTNMEKLKSPYFGQAYNGQGMESSQPIQEFKVSDENHPETPKKEFPDITL